MLLMKDIVPRDIVHVIFRIGYSARFLRQIKGRPLQMELARHRNNRGGTITAVVGNVESNDWPGREITVYATDARIANMELRAQAVQPHFQGGLKSAEVTIPYEYIGRIERIEYNVDADNDGHHKNPGQVQLNSERYNARMYRIPVTL